MKLTYASASPFVRKVLVGLIETGRRETVVLETVAVSPVKPGKTVPSVNPLGKIPCLVLDDGSALFDSRVITRYLDTLNDGDKLYPEGAALWPRLSLESLADGMMDAAILMTYEARLRPEAQQSSEWVEAQWGKITRALAYLEAHIEALKPVDMASIAVATALGYVDFRHQARNWRSLAPKLAAWEAAFSQRPAMVETAPA